MPTKKFWMLSVDGMNHAGPKVRHHDIDHARTEASRLAIANNNRVYIMEAVEACVPNLKSLVNFEPAEHTTADLKELGAGVNSDIVTGRSLAERVL